MGNLILKKLELIDLLNKVEILVKCYRGESWDFEVRYENNYRVILIKLYYRYIVIFYRFFSIYFLFVGCCIIGF